MSSDAWGSNSLSGTEAGTEASTALALSIKLINALFDHLIGFCELAVGVQTRQREFVYASGEQCSDYSKPAVCWFSATPSEHTPPNIRLLNL